MIILSVFASLGASLGWASGSMLAERPASLVGAFEFTRIQLLTSGAILALICSMFGLWTGLQVDHWPAFTISIVLSVIVGNLAMIECIRTGGPRITELLVSLKAPIVAVIAYLWLGESLTFLSVIGILIALSGIFLAILYGEGKGKPILEKDVNLLWVLGLGIAAAFFQGVGFLVLKPVLTSGADPFAVSAVRICGAAFLISLVGLWPYQGFQSKTDITPYLLMRTILPGFIGYGISTSLLLYALAHADAAVATILASLSPILILPLLWISKGKIPSVNAVLGAILAIVGVSMILLV
ncbi:EamA family transporter [Curvivirga sp.]|uniref:EamA family transporter n=1 Tax=Curvivirga sp. TaxID=2856848 RepID=UPI003B5CE1A0